MNPRLYSLILTVFTVTAAMLSLPSRADEESTRRQRHRTFAEAPGRRAEIVRQARLRALQDKKEVAAWAARRGVERRHDNGLRVAEIVAIRNNRLEVILLRKNR